MKNISILFLFFLLISGCSTQRGTIVSLRDLPNKIEWSPEELATTIAFKKLYQTNEASFHFVRLAGKEQPHVHDLHDLTIFVLSGKVKMHLNEKSMIATKGDVIEVPKGIIHWAENVNGKPSEAYIVFSPPFDDKDHRIIRDDEKAK